MTHDTLSSVTHLAITSGAAMLTDDLSDLDSDHSASLSAVPVPLVWPRVPMEDDFTDRIVSREAGEALLQRIAAMATGGGETQITVRTSWAGHLRWARNRPTTSGITMERWVTIHRLIDGGRSSTTLSQWDDVALKNAVQQVEARLRKLPIPFLGPQEYVKPSLWSEATFNLSAQARSDATRTSVIPIADAKLVAAGFTRTNVVSWGIYNTVGLRAYAVATGAEFTMRVRAPDGNGSGWAGASHTDWTQMSVGQLSARATEKCLASANPTAIEPGRYTVILEPEAAGAFFLRAVESMDRNDAEIDKTHPYHLKPGQSKIGLQVFDERLSIRTDPMDPDGPYIPFDDDGYPVRPVTWVEKGVLKELSYDLLYAKRKLNADRPLLNPLACRVINHGPATSIEEMIASTKRGVLVTLCGQDEVVHRPSLLQHTITRDGVWLIENGKIRMPVKNMHVLESPLFVLNQVVQIGAPVRTKGRRYAIPFEDAPVMALNDGIIPMVVPPLKVQDFNFSMLTDAI